MNEMHTIHTRLFVKLSLAIVQDVFGRERLSE
jgi:hypothetical protein